MKFLDLWTRSLITVVLVAAAVSPAGAQVGVTTDILTGVVVDASGEPLSNAVVEVLSLETEVVRTAISDARGRYIILFPDGGGQYEVTVRAVGMMPQTVVLVRHADEDRLIWDVQMQPTAYVLDPVVVTGERQPVRVPGQDRPTPGSVQRNFTPNQIANLPIDPDDLALLAALVPGAVVIEATDTTAASFSVAGQRPDANQQTLDGLSYASGQLPQEGLRSTRIITNTFDVSRGRFSGGLMASTSRSGTNNVQGSLNYSLRARQLSFQSGSETAFTSGSTQHSVGGGVGGPLISNRLFAYVSGSLRSQTAPVASLTSATEKDLERLGVAPDSAARFTTIVDSLGAGVSDRFDGGRSNRSLSGMLRLDWLASNNHTVSVRGDFRGTAQEPTQLPATALPDISGEQGNGGGGVMTTLSSQFGLRVINEFKAYASSNVRDGNPYQYSPQGQVRVTSDLVDGTNGVATLLMGGSTNMPTDSRVRALEVTDEVSLLPGDLSHRLKLGALFRVESTNDLTGRNQFGTYSYNSLAELEAGTPSSFRRLVSPEVRRSTAYEFAVYAGDVWIPTRPLQVNYGVRLERSTFGNPPAYNPAIDASFGRRTDVLPSETDLSPRVGFTWTVGGSGFGASPAFVIRGGVGKFRSPMSSQLVAQAQRSTGLDDSQAILNCTGLAVPIATWDRWGDVDSQFPTECDGAAVPVSRGATTATVFEPGYAAPKSWRASLGVQKNLTSILRLSVNANYARGVDQYGFNDLNLDTNGGFTLAGEANRPVYVPANTIDPTTGAVNFVASRVDTTFAQVLDISSAYQSDTKQISLALGGVTRNGVVLNASYTWSDVRDQTSQSVRGGRGSLGGATTPGNPNEKEWARSSFERRHTFIATVSYPFGQALDITGIGRLSSGTPFTPIVGSDINGDGARNDQAFVYDPSVLPGMQTVLGNASGSIRECLESQLGQVAKRNSCTGPWEGTLEFQLNYRPNFWGLNRRVTLSLTTINFLRGLDELFHSSDNLSGWGMRSRPNATLLTVDGFDQGTQEFLYTVNERFGATNPGQTAIRQPFQIGIQVRTFFGPDRGQQALNALRGGGGRGGGFGRGAGGLRGGGGGRGGFVGGAGGFTPEDFVDRFTALLIDPAGLVLGYADSIALTDSQTVQLQAMSDSLTAENDSIALGLQAELEELVDADPRELLQSIRPRLQAAQERVRDMADRIRDLLTDEQWEMLPEELRQAGRRRGPGQRRPNG